MATFRDAQGNRLEDYPRPSVAVDTAVLTVDPALGLSVVLTIAPAGPRLPGTFVHVGETLADAVTRSLRDKAGVEGLSPKQLHVFDAPGRDDRGWVMSVAHLETVAPDHLALDSGRAGLWPASDLPALPFDHAQVVARAVSALRAEYRSKPDPRRFLPDSFTLRDLHSLHQEIANEELGRDTFRRHMQPHLEETGVLTTGVVGKPARLFTRNEND